MILINPLKELLKLFFSNRPDHKNVVNVPVCAVRKERDLSTSFAFLQSFLGMLYHNENDADGIQQVLTALHQYHTMGMMPTEFIPLKV